MRKGNSKKIKQELGNCKRFISAVSPERELRIQLCRLRGKITYFAIQYLLYFDGNWRKIIRYDTNHRKAHKHIYHHKNKRHARSEYLGEVHNYNMIYTSSYDDIRKNYKKFEQNYFI